MDTETIRQFLVYVPLLLVLFGLTFAVAIDPYIGKKRRRIMLIIVALNVSLVAVDYLAMQLKLRWNLPAMRTLVDIYGYSARPIILLLFAYIVTPQQTQKKLWILISLNILIHLTALISPVCFTITAENQYIRGPLGYTCHVVSGILLAFLLFQTIREYSRVKRSEMWIPVFSAILVVAAVVLDSAVFIHMEGPASFTTIAMVCCTLFYYIWLHLQFVREHEQDLMAEQRIQIMMTQIQPHFLFNALNTIRALYAKDPPLADKTLEDFSTYLRQNLESLSQSDLIPITRELEHTRLYAEIEMLRFPNVRVEYRIGDEAFELPALTIQPLVENAIRHGVRSRKDGLVTVSTVREGSVHRIVIRDNGVGFDPKQPKVPEETHIGVENVKARVEQMCGGTMIMQSEIGKGTCVTLLIPDEKKEKPK